MPIVRRNKTNVFRTRRINFLPGNNVLSEEQLKDVMENSESFQNQLKNNVMTIMESTKDETVKQNLSPKKDEKKDAEEIQEVKDILESSIKVADTLIDEMYDIPTLEKIKELDSRKGIHDLVNAQIGMLRAEEIDNEEENQD